MKHCPIHMIRPFISVHWKVKSKKKVFLWLFTPNKSKLPCPSHYPAAQTCKFCPIASLTLSRPKIEHLIRFFQILSPIFAPHIMVIHGKRTTIFSIFVFLCLLTNSTYARTTEYENPKDTILDMMLYFDLKARQADKDYQGNGKTLATLDSLLAHPARSRHLYSIILVSPDSYNGKKNRT